MPAIPLGDFFDILKFVSGRYLGRANTLGAEECFDFVKDQVNWE